MLEKNIEKATINLIYDQPMLGNIAVTIGGVKAISSSVEAVAYTDGKGIYFNKDYIKNNQLKLKEKEITFIISHEVMHLVNLTFQRKKDRNHLLWNMATDYAINDILVSSKIGALPEFGVLYNAKYSKKSSEEIYELLKKENSSENININININLDDHSKLDNISNIEKQAVIQKVDNAIKQYSSQQSNLDRILSQREKILFNWKAALSNYIKHFKRENYSWKQPTKKSIALGCYLPSLYKKDFLNLAIAVDTSGSIDDKQLQNFMNHIFKIASQFKTFEIDYVCFSTEIHEDTYKIYKSSKDVVNPPIKSYGGTDISSSFSFFQNKKKKYDVFICFTDGYDDIDKKVIKKYNNGKVLWFIKGNDHFVAPSSKHKVFSYE